MCLSFTQNFHPKNGVFSTPPTCTENRKGGAITLAAHGSQTEQKRKKIILPGGGGGGGGGGVYFHMYAYWERPPFSAMNFRSGAYHFHKFLLKNPFRSITILNFLADFAVPETIIFKISLKETSGRFVDFPISKYITLGTKFKTLLSLGRNITMFSKFITNYIEQG